MIHVDHVLLATLDLELGAAQLRAGYGLESVAGGRHPLWGTANRIVPLGEQYLELVAAEDPDLAGTNPFGRAVLSEALAAGPRPLAVCLAGGDLEELAARLGIQPEAGLREVPDGPPLRWRSLGMSAAFGRWRLPFFIAWEDPERHPSRVLGSRAEARGIELVEVGGDPAQVGEWLGGEAVPGIRLVGGPPGVRSVTLATERGSVQLA